MENVSAGSPLAEALTEAGVPHGLLTDQGLEIAGRSYQLVVLKAVRDSDAVLLVRAQQQRRSQPVLVIADRISGTAREELSTAGIAWLDRRGHLWIRSEGLFVNTEVSASALPATRVVDVLSATGLDIALALLASPDEAQGVNELARRVGRSPGRVSEILKALRSEGMVEAGNRPVVPELFWDVAEHWSPGWRPLNTVPIPVPPEHYRLSGTLAAIGLGAPLVAGAGWPQLYVGDEADLAALVRPYGGAGWTAAAEVAVCPSRFGFSLLAGTSRDGYLLAGHLIVALDLAQDRARGREALESWSPAGVSHVW